MTIVVDFEQIIEEAEKSGEYWGKGVPGSMGRMNKELNAVFDKFKALPDEDKEIESSYISTDIAWSLSVFAEHMAT